MRHIWWTFIAIVAIFLIAGFIDLPQTKQFMGQKVQINKGIDLAGGVRLLLRADKGQNVTSGEMDVARNVIQNRAAGGLGVTEPQVSQVGNNAISVELPGVKNQQAAVSRIGKTGFLRPQNPDRHDECHGQSTRPSSRRTWLADQAGKRVSGIRAGRNTDGQLLYDRRRIRRLVQVHDR
jgi:preprotein translocase subunit SecD